jgi:hypothetical protein
MDSWAIWSRARTVPLVVAVLAVNGVALFSLARSIFLFMRAGLHGTCDLHFERFPFFLGDTLDVRLKTGTPLQVTQTRVVLRCVQETFQASSGNGSSDAADRIYAVEKSLAEVGSLSEDGRSFRISIPLPRGNYATDLKSPFPRYWELVILEETPGPDRVAVFLVPVYARLP